MSPASNPSTEPPGYAKVALDVPDIGQDDGFDYRIPEPLLGRLEPGAWVLVPWGRTTRIGIVAELAHTTELEVGRLKFIKSVLADAPQGDPGWLRLLKFASAYYHRSLGEVALPAIPKLLRQVPARPRKDGSERESIFARSRRRGPVQADAPVGKSVQALATADEHLSLTPGQAAVARALPLAGPFEVLLLHGVTGSGKTEVYLRWIADHLARDDQAQVLLLVPEINLTPQLLGRVLARFAGRPVAVLHSDLPDARRAADWLAAAEGRARIVIGTRLAVLAPLPRLSVIVVDEEHDPSYKQQEGVRYSARDLAIVRAQQSGVPVLLASATPSLESWQAAQRGRYRLLTLAERATGAQLPAIRLVPTRNLDLQHSLSPTAIASMRAALERGEQSLVFINRRGYSPVLCCESCGWNSQCDNCSAHRVLHRRAEAPRHMPAQAAGAGRGTSPGGGAGGQGAVAGAQDAGAAPGGLGTDTRMRRGRYALICHHCGAEQPVPRACPTCGNVDLKPLGRGTQRLEDGLADLFPQARIARLDRDVARRRNAAQDILERAQDGRVDILVGTQMLAKGHDFEKLAVVVVVDPDNGLYAADFRAPERLFATLMQVAGRAGRSMSLKARAEVIIQTRYPEHPLFAALIRHDYNGFAASQLREREQASLPPFVFQALLRAEAPELAQALAWLESSRESAARLREQPQDEQAFAPVVLFDPVPLAVVRVAEVERAQLLLESRSRKALHGFLDRWLPLLRAQKPPVSALRWQLEVDPIEI